MHKRGLGKVAAAIDAIQRRQLQIRRPAGDIEEERRLFYVGITRARDQLYITRAAMRLERGAEVPRKPSRFIEELSAPDLQIYEIAREERLSGADVQSMADAFLARLGVNTAG